VLKDEDLRKKYDMYGEDGLKEGGPTGHSYQSWSFYNQDFGIVNWISLEANNMKYISVASLDVHIVLLKCCSEVRWNCKEYW